MRLGTILLFLINLLFCGNAVATTLYMATDGTDSGDCTSTACLTLQYSMGQMASGDTLQIADGIYTGTANQINDANQPPNGIAEAYTTVTAENPGQVLFDGEDTRYMFNIVNAANGGQYIIFNGLKWGNFAGLDSTHAVNVLGMDYVKFIRCAAFNGGDVLASAWNIADSTYILLEDCYAWGSGRYKFIAYVSDHIIFRRCVARQDAIQSSSVVGNFQSYASQYVEWQNCIAIDSDTNQYWTGTYYQAAFGTHPVHLTELTDNNNWTGCIALKANGLLTLSADSTNLSMTNTVGYGLHYGIEGQSAGSTVIDHITIGSVTCYGACDNSFGATNPNAVEGWGIYSPDGDYGVTNSILYQAADSTYSALRGVSASDYNVLYDNPDDFYTGLTAGVHDFCADNGNTVDPIDGTPGNGIAALKYPIRIEAGSDIDGAADGGGDIGATITTKIGVSGTLHGEAGYDTDTGQSLWPFPYEDQIRTDMRTYNPGGADINQPDGLRGFCATGKTLTSYIWGYLGNSILPPKRPSLGGKLPTIGGKAPALAQ